jgi:hypothetical protein
MARTVTVSEIENMVRLRADLDGDFVTSGEFIQLISSAYTELYDMLVRAGLYPAEATQTITSTGASAYNLNNDFYAAISVTRQLSGKYATLNEIQVLERDQYRSIGGGVGLGYRLKRDATGVDQIEILPTPASGQVYEVLYVPMPAKLTSGSATIDGISGWEELITAIVVRRVRMREEASTSDIDREIAELRARIEEMAENRRIGQTLSIARVRSGSIVDGTGRRLASEDDWWW